MRQHVGADQRIESEAVHAVSGAVDKERRCAVKDVSRRHLFRAGLQYVHLGRAFGVAVHVTAQNGEDGADADVDIDIAGPVERIEDDYVLAVTRIAESHDRLLVLFRGQHADVAAIAQAGEQSLVCEDVELLDRLALDVGRARTADHVDKPCPANLGGDDFRGQRDPREQPGKLAAGMRVDPFLLLLDVLLNGKKSVALHGGRLKKKNYDCERRSEICVTDVGQNCPRGAWYAHREADRKPERNAAWRRPGGRARTAKILTELYSFAHLRRDRAVIISDAG